MRHVFAIVAIAMLAVPALAVQPGDVDFFNVTADGSFDAYRGGGPEGYSNGGSAPGPRLFKSNQHIGWMSWANTTGTNSGSSLSDFITAAGGASNVKATLYFRSRNVALPAAGTSTSGPVGAHIVSIRSGNVGNLVEDLDPDGVATSAAPAAGFQGSSQLVAFRGAQVPAGGGFPNFGDGIYVNNSPSDTSGVQGEAWVAPSGRAANSGASPFTFNAGDPIRYDISNIGNVTGLYDGYFQDTTAGRNYWAFEDLIGLRGNNGRASGGPAQIEAAGQLLAKDPVTGNYVVVNDAYAGATDAKGSATAGWNAIALDMTFVSDMASNPQFKGIAFVNNVLGLASAGGNYDYYSLGLDSGQYAPYLALEVVPEPATLCLLAIGGLALIRRRA